MKKNRKEMFYQTANVLHIIAIVTLLSGCYTIGSGPMVAPIQHQYELTVINMDNEPIDGATIDYTIKEDGQSYYEEREPNVKSNTFITKSDGILRDSLLVIGWGWNNANKESMFNCVVTKTGYYAQSQNMDSDYGCVGTGFDNIQVVQDSVILVRPIDYFNKDFILTLSENAVKDEILSFIDLILLEGLIANTSLDLHSIDFANFKNEKYLQFKFSNNNIYNSLQLNKYDIGKILFDEVIRKILNPLNDYISESDSFFGYDLTVVGRTKSFAQTYGGMENVDFRFLIPKIAVNEYKDKDISGQQLLDKSVILMDDERVELKLQ
jgi:hypothetical protein